MWVFGCRLFSWVFLAVRFAVNSVVLNDSFSGLRVCGLMLGSLLVVRLWCFFLFVAVWLVVMLAVVFLAGVVLFVPCLVWFFAGYWCLRFVVLLNSVGVYVMWP